MIIQLCNIGWYICTVPIAANGFCTADKSIQAVGLNVLYLGAAIVVVGIDSIFARTVGYTELCRTIRDNDTINLITLIIRHKLIHLITGGIADNIFIWIKEYYMHIIKLITWFYRTVNQIPCTVVDKEYIMTANSVIYGWCIRIITIRLTLCLVSITYSFSLCCYRTIVCRCTVWSIVIAQGITYLLSDIPVTCRTVVENNIRINYTSALSGRLEYIDCVAAVVNIFCLCRNTRPCSIFTVNSTVVIRIYRLTAVIIPVIFVSEVDVIEIRLDIKCRNSGIMKFCTVCRILNRHRWTALCHGVGIFLSVIKLFGITVISTVTNLKWLCIFREPYKILTITNFSTNSRWAVYLCFFEIYTALNTANYFTITVSCGIELDIRRFNISTDIDEVIGIAVITCICRIADIAVSVLGLICGFIHSRCHSIVNHWPYIFCIRGWACITKTISRQKKFCCISMTIRSTAYAKSITLSNSRYFHAIGFKPIWIITTSKFDISSVRRNLDLPNISAVRTRFSRIFLYEILIILIRITIINIFVIRSYIACIISRIKPTLLIIIIIGRRLPKQILSCCTWRNNGLCTSCNNLICTMPITYINRVRFIRTTDIITEYHRCITA